MVMSDFALHCSFYERICYEALYPLHTGVHFPTVISQMNSVQPFHENNPLRPDFPCLLKIKELVM